MRIINAQMKNMKKNKETLLYKIEDFLKRKNTGEYHSHTFAETIYISERTYRKAIRVGTLYYYLPNVKGVRHMLYQIYISENRVSISTSSYYMPVLSLSMKEMELVYKTMQEECLGQE